MRIDTMQQTTANRSMAMPQQHLGQQEFLNLLVAELRNQNPLKPMDQKDFITQLAQFSNLEALHAVSQTLNSLQATNLLNTMVRVKTISGQVVEGLVESVTLGPKVGIVVQGIRYGLQDILEVSVPPQKSVLELDSEQGVAGDE